MADTPGRSCTGTIGNRGLQNSLERMCEVTEVPRYTGYNWMCLEVSLVGNSTYSQKGVSSLSCRRKLRRSIEYPARIESWRESQNSNNNNNNIVFDFFGGYQAELRKELRSITNTHKEFFFVIESCQEWIIYQDANIVKKFYQ